MGLRGGSPPPVPPLTPTYDRTLPMECARREEQDERAQPKRRGQPDTGKKQTDVGGEKKGGRGATQGRDSRLGKAKPYGISNLMHVYCIVLEMLKSWTISKNSNLGVCPWASKDHVAYLLCCMTWQLFPFSAGLPSLFKLGMWPVK